MTMQSTASNILILTQQFC